MRNSDSVHTIKKTGQLNTVYWPLNNLQLKQFDDSMQLRWQSVLLHLCAHGCKGSLKLKGQAECTKGAKS